MLTKDSAALMSGELNWQRFFGRPDIASIRAEIIGLVPEDLTSRVNIKKLKALDKQFDRLDRLYQIAAEQFNQLADEIRAGVAILIDNQIIFANPKLAEILGYAGPREIEGKDYRSYIVEPDALLVDALLEQGGKATRVVQLRRLDGSLVEAECTRRALSYDAGARLTVVRVAEPG